MFFIQMEKEILKAKAEKTYSEVNINFHCLLAFVCNFALTFFSIQEKP